MIAPLRPPLTTTAEKPRPLHKAHQVVAAAMLRPEPETQDTAAPVRSWPAWAFTVWVLGVVAVYFCSMIGLF